ncbi:hypothetical protein [Pseudarthrobacter quantipunctorum]|uniref:Uncharacterized protein n=1 Tax=Pseudarthrobacter quantipunctorum TaxID=3128980 RepID=A0ABZ2RAD9_9MICC
MTRRGYNRISPAALRHTLETVAAEAFGVPGKNVDADLRDDGGTLGAAISVQLPLPPLLSRGPGPAKGAVALGGTAAGVTAASGTLFEQARRARDTILRRGADLSGLQMGTVDITLAGAGQPQRPSRVDSSHHKQQRHQERRPA